MTAHVESGRKGGLAVRWRREPCPAELSWGDWVLTCQAQQVWQDTRNGPHRLHHGHRWAGWVNGQWVLVTWKAGT